MVSLTNIHWRFRDTGTTLLAPMIAVYMFERSKWCDQTGKRDDRAFNCETSESIEYCAFDFPNVVESNREHHLLFFRISSQFLVSYAVMVLIDVSLSLTSQQVIREMYDHLHRHNPIYAFVA